MTSQGPFQAKEEKRVFKYEIYILFPSLLVSCMYKSRAEISCYTEILRLFFFLSKFTHSEGKLQSPLTGSNTLIWITFIESWRF